MVVEHYKYLILELETRKGIEEKRDFLESIMEAENKSVKKNMLRKFKEIIEKVINQVIMIETPLEDYDIKQQRDRLKQEALAQLNKLGEEK